MPRTISQVHQVEYHRNGVSGVPFHAVLFRSTQDEELMGIVFPEIGHCAVLCPGNLDAFGVTFGANSFRGDVFEAELRAAIAEAAD